MASDVHYIELPERAHSQFGGMRTRAPAMRDVYDALGRLARTDLTITLLGETGAGKSRLAQAIHDASARGPGSCVVLDRGSSLGDGASTRVLGCERTERPGVFEEAHEGTLFIEEVGELSPDVQMLLVCALANGRVRRVGGTRDIPVDVRVIATSNTDLEAEVAAGRFRQDLYFRLAGAVVRIPPLRNRVDDFPMLISALLADLGRTQASVSHDALAQLQSRAWPGNLRELKNTLAFALALADSDRLELRDLDRLSFGTEAATNSPLELAGMTLDQLERMAIKQTLERVRGNKVRAAKMLGIAVSTLYEKLKRFSIS